MADEATQARRERWALNFTFGVAVLSGLLWVVTLVVDEPPAFVEGVRGVLILLVVVGGIAMGALYLSRRLGSG